MTRLQLAVPAAVAVLGAIACIVLLAVTSCTDPGPRAWVRWYGEPPTAETLRRVAAVLPVLPASPWPCVTSITLGSDEACAGTEGCYWPDQRAIFATQDALAHELAHAAAECAGDYDPGHRAAWWPEVDGIR